MSNNINKWQPLIYALLISLGLLLGIYLKPANFVQNFTAGNNKFSELLSIIDQSYVDSINIVDMEEKTINNLLNSLDPHSVYIPASRLKLTTEQLEGNFEGIGIEFNIFGDTIMVVSAISGGPAQELGIQPGDRIIKVETLNVAGVGVTSDRVFKLLKGKGGTEVNIVVYRPSSKQMIPYKIIRSKIPIYSVDAWMMLNTETGYIKVSRFAENTHKEFLKAFSELEKQGLKNLVLDLRGNPGGYLSAAIDLADEFLDDRKLIVYTQGRTKPRAQYEAEHAGIFEKGKLVVLIDEGSASASEIVSGAVQDWDRGIIVGRRSFGKGLVQEPYEFKDGSALHLTVSRYYTPSGRCIQKDYSNSENYQNDLLNRFENGEMEDYSKRLILDSTPYHTKELNRTVFGGGGISPDLFVPLDTSYNSHFLTLVVSNALIGKFAYDYLDRNRNAISAISSLKVFNDTYQISNLAYKEFITFVVSQGILAPPETDNRRSEEFIKLQIKALIARQIWRDQGYYAVIQKDDKALKQALFAIEHYKTLLSANK
ncbi:MAG: S41 family peptidase [Bacteroidota bacterium]|nr:S41 family peptidase [Bacteroidota bacterium]